MNEPPRGFGADLAHGRSSQPFPGPASKSIGVPPDPIDSKLMYAFSRLVTSRSVINAAAPIRPASSASVTSTITDQLGLGRAASTRAASSDTATPSASSAAPGPIGTES